MSAAKLGESLSWQEIKAWSEMTGTTPNPDECELMIAMSNAWSREYQKGCKKGAGLPRIAEVLIYG